MRLVITLLAILLAVVAGDLWVSSSIEKSSNDFSKQIHEITSLISQDNWQGANSQLVKMEKDWSQNREWWHMVMEHREIENIEFSLAKTKEFVRERDKVLAMGYLAELRLIFLHLPEGDRLSLKNIL